MLDPILGTMFIKHRGYQELDTAPFFSQMSEDRGRISNYKWDYHNYKLQYGGLDLRNLIWSSLFIYLMEVEFAWEVHWISSLLILCWVCVHRESMPPELLCYHIVFLSFAGKIEMYWCVHITSRVFSSWFPVLNAHILLMNYNVYLSINYSLGRRKEITWLISLDVLAHIFCSCWNTVYSDFQLANFCLASAV